MPISSGWDSWDNVSSDPIADLRGFFAKILNERWICKGCAFTSIYPPQEPGRLACPECGAIEWHYTTQEKVEI